MQERGDLEDEIGDAGENLPFRFDGLIQRGALTDGGGSDQQLDLIGDDGAVIPIQKLREGELVGIRTQDASSILEGAETGEAEWRIAVAEAVLTIEIPHEKMADVHGERVWGVHRHFQVCAELGIRTDTGRVRRRFFPHEHGISSGNERVVREGLQNAETDVAGIGGNVVLEENRGVRFAEIGGVNRCEILRVGLAVGCQERLPRIFVEAIKIRAYPRCSIADAAGVRAFDELDGR